MDYLFKGVYSCSKQLGREKYDITLGHRADLFPGQDNKDIKDNKVSPAEQTLDKLSSRFLIRLGVSLAQGLAR